MSVPTRINDELAEDVKRQADRKGRSFASQVEYWTALGKMVERSLTGAEIDKLLDGSKVHLAREEEGPLSMATIRNKVMADKGPVSSLTNADEWYIAAPGRPGFIIRLNKKGEKVTGKFKHGKFVPDKG